MTVAQFPPSRRFDGMHGPEDRRHSEPHRIEPPQRSGQWIRLCVGICALYCSMYTLIARPMAQRVNELTYQVKSLQIGMRQLADARDGVTATNDLLTSLQLQTERLRGARLAVEQVRRLQREVQEQSEVAGDAIIALQQVGQLQSAVIAESRQLATLHGALDDLTAIEDRISTLSGTATQQGEGIAIAAEKLQQLGALKRRVAIESQGIDTAQTQLSRLVGLKKAVEHAGNDGVDSARASITGLSELKQQVIAAGTDVPLARTISDSLIGLQHTLIHGSTQVDAARDHASELLAMEAALCTTPPVDIVAAHQNLDQLIGLEQKLVGQDDTIRVAVESLELLTNLQEEFHVRVGQLESVRRGLTELVILESTVARTVRALQPLTELTSLQRLNGAEIREIARLMLNQETRRVAIHDASLPVTGDVQQQGDGVDGPNTERLVPLPIEDR